MSEEIVAKAKAFLVGVQFIKRGGDGQPPASVAQAFLQFQDDADCHPFKVAVSAKDAHKFSKYLEGFEGEEFADIEITITLREDEE
jgi:hypothetical protein